MSYLDVVYDKKEKPYTDYPHQLCKYLFERYEMKKGERILDVGCGRGDFTKSFKDIGLEAFGVDIEPNDSELLQGIEVKVANAERDKLPFEGGSFDIVFSKSVIEHLWNPENFISESQRVLRPGGRIIVMTPDWHSQRVIFYDDHTHVHPYTVTGLRDLLKIYGWDKVEAEKFYQLPVLWKHPWVKVFSKMLQATGPVKKIHKNKFVRWSRELMILASGIKAS